MKIFHEFTFQQYLNNIHTDAGHLCWILLDID